MQDKEKEIMTETSPERLTPAEALEMYDELLKEMEKREERGKRIFRSTGEPLEVNDQRNLKLATIAPILAEALRKTLDKT